MIISYNWISQYIDHKLSPKELENALTMVGLEVEHVSDINLLLNDVVVGRILSVKPHPDADRLTICTVDLGYDKPEQIVCGAPNVAVDQWVPVALVGSKLSINGKQYRIKRSKIRGQESKGMICSENELGISTDHQGIMVLSGNCTAGEPLEDYLHREHLITNDTVFDIAITPNRPDATCHLGVARDLSALQNVSVKFPEVTLPETTSEIAANIEVQIECPDVCSRYVAMVVQGVKVQPSPLWLKRRLESIGLRSINNVVDATNFVMYECGQPLHAFDYDRIDQQKIIVRESLSDEKFVTLDGKEHTLEEGVVLICDGTEPVAIGGVMGGKNSEVDQNTSNVLIESAWFDPSRTRCSAKALGISTDASYRFERGVDTNLQPWAAMRTALLIVELGGGMIINGAVDVHPVQNPATTVDLRFSRVAQILGIQVQHHRIVQILTSLGFDPIEKKDGVLTCKIPSHRPDVKLEIDLIEEIVRIHGFENIKLLKRGTAQMSAPIPRPDDRWRELTVSTLIGHGFREIYTNSLLPDDIATQFSHEVIGANFPPARTLNAVSKSMDTLRPSLLPGMLMVMQHNANYSQRVLRFFEIGHVFHKSDQLATYIENYSEYAALLLGVSGPVRPDSWDQTTRITDFFDLKGDVCSLLDQLLPSSLEMKPSHVPTELTDYHITLYSDETRVGTLAKLSSNLQKQYSLPDPVFFAEFNWTRLFLLNEPRPDQTYASISFFPVVERDLAVTVDRSQPVADMIKVLKEVGQPLLQSVNVFDVYTGEGIPMDQKSIAFGLRFGTNRTLRDKEIDQVMKKNIQSLSDQFNAKLRN